MLAIAALAAASSVVATGAVPVSDWNRAIIEVTDMDSLSLSPDGRLLLFRTSKSLIDENRVLLTWHVLDTTSGKSRPVGSGGEAIFDDPGVLRAEVPLWLADSQTALVRQHVDGATGIWAYSRSQSTMRPAVVRDADVEHIRLGTDGQSVVYDVGASRASIRQAEEAERDTGIRISSNVDLSQSLVRGARVEGRAATQRLSGYWYMRGGLLAKAPRQTRRWDPVTGVDEAVGPPKVPEPFNPPSVTAAASLTSRYGLAEAQWDGFGGSLQWVPVKGTKIRCDALVCKTMRVASLVWASEGRELLATFADRHHRQILALWDLNRNRFRLLTKGEGLLSGSRRGSIPCAIGRAAAYCIEASAVRPPALVRVDFRDGSLARLYDPNESLRDAYNPSVEPISFQLGDGRPVTGVLLGGRKRAGEPAPLFINYYRCEGFLRGGEGDEWPIAALIDAGFLFACMNNVPFKGSQDAMATYETGLAAVRALINTLVTQDRVDPGRVAMGGFSFGSEVAMWTAMKSDLLAAVSIASGQTEHADYWYGAIMGPTHDKVTREVWGLGPPEQTPARWREISPALNVSSIRAPVLLQLPEQEARRVPELFVRLRNGGTPVEFYAYPDEAHIKVEPKHRAAVFERNFDWVTYWLNDRRAAESDKAEQYRRWDDMRDARSTRPVVPPNP